MPGLERHCLVGLDGSFLPAVLERESGKQDILLAIVRSPRTQALLYALSMSRLRVQGLYISVRLITTINEIQ